MRYCFCVLGWYFYEDFFAQLYSMPGDKYVVSHRAQAWLDAATLPPGVRDDLIVFPNVGLDWGLYYQFKNRVDVTQYDFIVYIHDDVVIKDTSFPARLEAIFAADEGIKVIGNGKNGNDWEFRYGKYCKRMLWPDADDFIVRTVRGSFFAARTDIFGAIGGNFPVWWRVTPGPKQNKANNSLRNFGYIVSKVYGRDAITYLDWDNYLDTPYLSELVRGAR